jgi:ferredoxin
MSDGPAKPGAFVITRDAVGRLIDCLAADAYQVMGPTVRDGAIVYDTIGGIADLPVGWTDRQQAGHYHLERRDDAALFGFVVGPQSWKRFLHPPVQTMWTMRRTGDAMHIEVPDPAPARYAFIGVRACELSAMAVQDRVFAAAPYPDAGFVRRRRDAFIVAVNCGEAGGTCFCVSMQTGPRAAAGFDLALTELLDAAGHRFLVEVGSDAGAAMLARLDHRAASQADIAAAAAAVAHATAHQGRAMQTAGLKELLQENPDHPRWDAVAARCLSCGNCTMVCPTCFCTTVEDHTDLTGQSAERVRSWDSCFTMDFSYLHGGSVRQSGQARYRQWMTHKLASWIDQFGTSGCVGCGRCITWCPVGIDITEEAAAMQAAPDSQGTAHEGS